MTTATHDHITRPDALSEQETLRHNLATFVNQLTDNGNRLAQFMWDVVQGEYPDAKLHHRQQAARDLAVMGGQMPQDTPGSAARVVRVSDDESDPKPQKPKVTLKQILNKPVGAYIREETNNCRTLISALSEILSPPRVFESANPAEQKYQKATRIRVNHQIAAAKEMVKRSLGGRSPYCQTRTSPAEERMLNSRLSREIREITDNGIGLARFLLEVVDNPKTYGPRRIIIEDPYTQTHRIWAIRDLIYRGSDIPWEHITPESIDACIRDLDAKERQEAELLLALRQESANARLTPEQEAEVLAIFEESQRKLDESAAKDAAIAEKKAKKAAKKADADKADAMNYNNAGNRNNAAANGKNNASADNTAKDNNAADTANSADAPPGATATPSTDRGATAVANAIARHPEVDLDTALANHHATAGIPKENLTHEQIYDAIISEANFQKRQAIIQRRLRQKNPDSATEDNDPPKTRSP